MRVLAGIVFNLAGIPGIVRDCDYDAGVHDARITVRANTMFTIISVNGLDIYFHRLTGAIDGVGLSASPNCTSDPIPESKQFLEQPEFSHHTVHNRTP